MVSKTHMIGGLSFLIYSDVVIGGYTVNVPTAFFATSAAVLGALTPDLDKPTSFLYQKIPLGSILGRIIHPVFIGGHRHLSHSLIGLAIYGFLSNLLLLHIPTYIGLNTQVIWWSYMIGVVSHLILDSMTKEGLPLLFPLKYKFGIPPIKALRVTTGKWVEHLIVFPLLLASIAFCYLHFYYIFNY